MKTISVRNLKIGAGRPKIAVSLTGTTVEALLAQAEALFLHPVDVAEWRLDCFGAVEDTAALQAALQALRKALRDMPLLCTFRTKAEGGAQEIAPAAYEAVCETVLQSGCADLLDLELFTDRAILSRLVEHAHRANVFVVLSSHDFEKTPPQAELLTRFREMEALHGDLLKIAAMPRCPQDVLTLLSACAEMHAATETPLVAISMGNLGKVSRICGEGFGSALTFAALGGASAPGQMKAEAVQSALNLLQIDK